MPGGGTCPQRTRERGSEAWHPRTPCWGRSASATPPPSERDGCRRSEHKRMAVLDCWPSGQWSEAGPEGFPGGWEQGRERGKEREREGEREGRRERGRGGSKGGKERGECGRGEREREREGEEERERLYFHNKHHDNIHMQYDILDNSIPCTAALNLHIHVHVQYICKETYQVNFLGLKFDKQLSCLTRRDLVSSQHLSDAAEQPAAS